MNNTDSRLSSVPDITPNFGDPEPPEGLGPKGRALWDSITSTFDFRDEPQKISTLEMAARTADTVHALEEAVVDQPLIMQGSMKQPVANPLIQEARMQRGTLNQLLKSLQLPENDEETAARAERRSNAGKVAANARWGNK